MCKVLTTLCLLTFSHLAFCQAQQTTNAEVKSKTESISHLPNSVETPEPTPSLEEQGFTKIQKGEFIIYRKEINGVIIEIDPNKQ